MLPQRGQEGFTLIELLIVIAIIGILAAVLIPNLLNARERAFDTAAQTCLKELATVEEIYHIDNFEYDGSLTAAAVESQSCDNVDVTAETGTGDYSALYAYTASHNNSDNMFSIEAGSGVARVE